MESAVSSIAGRYAAWSERNRTAIVAGSIAFVAAAAVLASRLEVNADLSYLLPQSSRSVQDARVIERRARVIGTAMVTVESASPEHRARAAVIVRDRIVALGPTLVENVTFDRRLENEFAWQHRWLFVELADLEAARDGLAAQLARARLEANPLYVAIDEPEPPRSTGALRDRLRAAEREHASSSELISKDGRLQLMIVRTAFATADVDRDRELVSALEQIRGDVERSQLDVEVGITGDAVVSVVEHDGILSGMLKATAVTVILVLLGLAWFFRSALVIGALSWSLVVGTVATFAFAKLALGYLNVATAFLSSIVVGNGINVGIIVTARYVEELRSASSHPLATALEKTVVATSASTLTAAIAYGSLVITEFRGFHDFGIIGGAGIVLCWLAAYLVLPAALSIAHARGVRLAPRPSASWLAKLAPTRPTAIALATLAVVVTAGAIAGQYLFDDPFEDDLRNLRSQSDTLAGEQRTMTKIDRAFGVGMDAGFAVAVEREADTPRVAEAMRAADGGTPEARRLFGRVITLDDMVPADQVQKLAVLAEIRTLLSSRDVDALDEDDRAEALRLRPPDDLHVVNSADIPAAAAQPFLEADGSRGRLILATPGAGYDDWKASDTIRFARDVRAVQLPDDVHLGGSSFVFADVMQAVLVDGPRASLAAALGAIAIVLLVVGLNRFALIALACGASGVVLMLGVGAVLGFKINFLDFIALPITIGIGIEYATNLVVRVRDDGPTHIGSALGSTGGAVALCSFTTIVGYGALRLSENLGIRSFGLAAMLGELTCLAAALLIAPALASLLSERRLSRS